MTQKKNKKLLKFGIVGSIIAALCCFTPILVALFGAIGLGAAIGLIDFIVVPALVIFLAVTIYALIKSKQ